MRGRGVLERPNRRASEVSQAPQHVPTHNPIGRHQRVALQQHYSNIPDVGRTAYLGRCKMDAPSKNFGRIHELVGPHDAGHVTIWASLHLQASCLAQGSGREAIAWEWVRLMQRRTQAWAIGKPASLDSEKGVRAPEKCLPGFYRVYHSASYADANPTPPTRSRAWTLTRVLG